MHKHKSKPKSHRWGTWSEWTWDSTQQANVRVRQDSQGSEAKVLKVKYRPGFADSDLAGHLEYDWDQQDLNPAGHARTPRDAGVADITDRLNSLSPTGHEAHFEAAEEYAYADGATESTKSKKGKSKHKEKERSHRRHASSEEKSSTASHHGAMYTESAGLQYVQSSYGTDYQQQDPTTTVDYSQYGSAPAAYYNVLSRTTGRGAFDEEGEASSSQMAAAAQLYTGEEFDGTSHGYGNEITGTHETLALREAGELQSECEGSPMPPPETAAGEENVPGIAEGGAGELDPRYRIEHSARFQPGEIFKVHWSEPQGSMSEQPRSSSSKKQDLQNEFGTKFFVGFRRFIVVANDQGHCTCVPILTYGGKGCKKHGVKPEKHGIVYERGQKSKRLDGEPSLGFSPVRVEMTEEGEKISRESRVNYSKLVTVEHNVKVFFIGHVYSNDWQIVGDAVNSCWEKKIHQKQRRK
ncbi:hypothetical protein LLEC1_04280 [Akanthomyces lecanii]|uniref:DUF6590 domain-containing protein n=1 Tax=Cordyceps confragosa TaxID=2714763 RepID=A0A179IQ93_CORDF|nr:hypothetical protein LLEC1_04280 [Akanthomyces lecanii]